MTAYTTARARQPDHWSRYAMTTDLRAALRDAANALARIGLRRDADLIASLRALADAPPTVAELLAAPEFLAGTHQIVDDVRRIQCIDGIATVVSAQGKSLLWWIPNASVLVKPARLVEAP